jgi:hypothetical protein
MEGIWRTLAGCVDGRTEGLVFLYAGSFAMARLWFGVDTKEAAKIAVALPVAFVATSLVFTWQALAAAIVLVVFLLAAGALSWAVEHGTDDGAGIVAKIVSVVVGCIGGLVMLVIVAGIGAKLVKWIIGR